MASLSSRSFVYLCLGFAGGLWAAYGGVKNYLIYQKIRDTPTSKAEAAAIGMVELSGKIRSDRDMRSPLTSARCAYWSVRAQYYKASFPRGWPELYKATSRSPFFVEDETGSIMVEPEGALIDIPLTHQYTGNISGKENPDVPNGKIDAIALKFIEGLDNPAKARFMEHKDDFIMVTEMYIAEGDPIYVLGNAAEKQAPQDGPGYRNLVIKKGGDILYIRNSPEKAILSEKKSLIPWQIIGGTLISGVCLALLLLTLNV